LPGVADDLLFGEAGLLHESSPPVAESELSTFFFHEKAWFARVTVVTGGATIRAARAARAMFEVP
jgi:hypothetical protein